MFFSRKYIRKIFRVFLFIERDSVAPFETRKPCFFLKKKFRKILFVVRFFYCAAQTFHVLHPYHLNNARRLSQHVTMEADEGKSRILILFSECPEKSTKEPKCKSSHSFSVSLPPRRANQLRFQYSKISLQHSPLPSPCIDDRDEPPLVIEFQPAAG